MNKQQLAKEINRVKAINNEKQQGSQLPPPPEWLTGERERNVYHTYETQAYLIGVSAEELAKMVRTYVSWQYWTKEATSSENEGQRNQAQQARDNARKEGRKLQRYEAIIRRIDPDLIPDDLTKYIA